MDLRLFTDRYTTTLRAACVALTLTAPLPAAANLIQNGSFEDPVVPNASFTNFLSGSTAITGWTVVGIDTAIVDGDFTQSGITFQAQDGNQWADLAGINSNSALSGLTQTVATIVGELYELSFYVGSATDGRFFFPTAVDVSINGGGRTKYTNPNAPTTSLDWMRFSLQFTATSAATSLTFFNGAAANNFSTAFDNVSLVQVREEVPEPGSLALVGVGLAGLTLHRRRSQANKPGASLAF
ncbi:MAG: DUF642 domain-containing protein [Gammaproteobacteria bacterium]